MTRRSREREKLYSIRPLKWLKRADNTYQSTPITGMISAWSSPFSEGLWVCSNHSQLCRSIEQCKERAEREYRRVILKALRPVTTGSKARGTGSRARKKGA